MVEVWTESLVSRLLVLWDKGESIRSMALALTEMSPHFITPDMVSGKVNRLKKRGIIISSRPSPIKPRPPKPAVRQSLRDPCSFITGDARTGIRCTDESLPHKPYCLKHCLVCYPKMRQAIAKGDMTND